MRVHGIATITPPFRCDFDYGYDIHVGENASMNYDCVILDITPLIIGGMLLGPGVHLDGATHPMSSAERQTGLDSGGPITIEDDVRIGGRSVIGLALTGVPGLVIGAASVVTRGIPVRVFAAGNACRVRRIIPSASEESRHS